MELIKSRVMNSNIKVGNKLEDILFPVTERPLSYMWNNNVIPLGNNPGGEEITNYKLRSYDVPYKAIINNLSGECLSVMTESYHLFPNEKIVEKITPALSQGWNVSRVMNDSNRRFEIHLGNPDIQFPIGKYEDARLKCVIKNSYDGTCAFQIFAGFDILICGNGARMKTGIEVYKRHINGINEMNFALDTDVLEGYVKRVMDGKRWHNDQDKAYSQFEKLTKFLPDTKDGKHPMKILLASFYEKEIKTYDREFALFMAATDLSTHGLNYSFSQSYLNELDGKIPHVFELGDSNATASSN